MLISDEAYNSYPILGAPPHKEEDGRIAANHDGTPKTSMIYFVAFIVLHRLVLCESHVFLIQEKELRTVLLM